MANTASLVIFAWSCLSVGLSLDTAILPDRTLPNPDHQYYKAREMDDTLSEEVETAYLQSLGDHLHEKGPSGDQAKSDLILSPQDLGGIHPKEVVYFDKDILIIKGMGNMFTPNQQLPQVVDDRKDEYVTIHKLPNTHPNYNTEYNGNVPSFALPPNRHNQPTVLQPVLIPLLVPITNWNGQIYWPMSMVPITNGLPPVQDVYHPVSQMTEYPQPSHRIRIPSTWQSLYGDTKVNYLSPKPSIDPDAEIINVPPRPQRPNQKYSRLPAPRKFFTFSELFKNFNNL